MNRPEILELISLVEQKHDKPLSTSTDFEEFSLYLQRFQLGNVSASTLKRMWGYVNDSHVPRQATLNVLANYLGHDSFFAFVEWLKSSPLYNSSFFTADQLSSNNLIEGDIVEIGWRPNRLIHLKYKGDNLYEIIKAENSKLMKGDSFITGSFIKGQPIYLPYIIRNGGKTSPFVAGRNGGITCISVIREKSEVNGG